MGTRAMRAQLEWYRGTNVYTVVDRFSGCVVIQTSSYALADYWRDRVNQCGHPLHYDIVEHDHKVARWAEENGESI